MARLEIGADKADDVVDRGHPGKALGGLVDPVAQGSGRMEQKLVGIAQSLDVLAAEAAALHADDVEAGEPGAVADHLAIGNHVALDTRHAADHRVPADADKLMHRAQAAEKRVSVDNDMAGQSRVVGHDHVIADLAVMRHMGANHKQAIVADAGDQPAAGGAGIDRHIFADRVAAADREK